jgi:hypothetical protein
MWTKKRALPHNPDWGHEYQNNPDYARHAIKELNIKQKPRVASYTGFKTIENKSGLEQEYCNSF